jgi:hypothetical protein
MPTCAFAFVGDPAAPIELYPGVAQKGEFVELHDGDALPLVAPPQGGHVSFVAARATNVDPCRVQITATLRSPRSMRIITEESRTIALRPLPTGWAEPNLTDISSVANVPMCPDYHDESIVDTDYTLDVRLSDGRGSALSGMALRAVVPRCLEEFTYLNALCRCECRANYTLGSCANPLDAALESGPAVEAGDER